MLNNWRYGKDAATSNYTINDEYISTENLKKHLDSSDIAYKSFTVGGYTLCLVYAEGLINQTLVDECIVKPLVLHYNDKIDGVRELAQRITSGMICHAIAAERTLMAELAGDILNGFTAIVSDDLRRAYTYELKGQTMRAISEAENESSVKAPKDSFIEILRVNTSLIRSRIRTPDLKIEQFTIGTQGGVAAAIVYMGSLADQVILNELRERVSSIEEDIHCAGAFEERIIDRPYSIFPQTIFTERPDKLCSNVSDGKIGILIEGLPFAYIVPAVFGMFMQTPEDYSNSSISATIFRIIRYACIITAVILPGFFVSICTYNQECLPTELAKSIIRSKEGIPFSMYAEMIFFITAFEILLESGTRLPKTIGHSIPIIGGLVIGQAAVQAKFVSPSVVIIAAVAGIAGFVIPNHDMFNSMRLCRIFLTLCGCVYGLFGIAAGCIILMLHMTSLESFGVPYMTPFTSNDGRNIERDTFARQSFGKR